LTLSFFDEKKAQSLSFLCDYFMPKKPCSKQGKSFWTCKAEALAEPSREKGRKKARKQSKQSAFRVRKENAFP
jgi:hypothetical protein